MIKKNSHIFFSSIKKEKKILLEKGSLLRQNS